MPNDERVERLTEETLSASIEVSEVDIVMARSWASRQVQRQLLEAETIQDGDFARDDS